MFILNASPETDDSAHNDVTSRIQSDCLEVMQLCGLDILVTHFKNERLIIESEELTQVKNDIVGIISLKYIERNYQDIISEQPYMPVYSKVNNDAATTSLIDIFIKALNRSYGFCGYVSARNAWFEVYNMPRSICINIARCRFPVEFEREVPAYGERIAIGMIAYLLYLFPGAKQFFIDKCSDYFGDRSDYLNDKYPFELD